jgi:hypothetical protein
MRTTALATAACIFALASTGCTTLALKRQSLKHSESAMDLRYREAIENLAVISANPAVLPAFTSIFSGTTNVQDTVPFNSNNVLSVGKAGAAASFAGTMDYPLTRSVTQNWTLDPTITPEKLRAMRCACWWIVFGPNNQCGDCSSLYAYSTQSPPGYYFDVAGRLAAIRPGWLRKGGKHDVSKAACYKAHCGDHYVWVLPNDMDCLSQFALILQSIARVQDDSVLFPKINTTKVVLDASKLTPQLKQDWLADTEYNGFKTNKITLYVDQDGFPTPGSGIPSLPRKVRFDNVGLASDLKSAIVAALKGP